MFNHIFNILKIAYFSKDVSTLPNDNRVKYLLTDMYN